MLRLVVVDHSFVEPTQRKRWRLLAERHPVDVTLLVPSKWRSDWFGDPIRYRPEPVDEERYSVVPLPTSSRTDWMKYVFRSPDAKLRSLDPDLIHVQYGSMALIHHQMLLYRRLWAPDAKYMFFTMNALGVPRDRLDQRVRWRHLRAGAEAALGHYPGCLDSLRDAGFDKPIYLQTSYGVDESLFYPDEKKRAEVREELGFEDLFLVGYTGRLTGDKGVDDLLEVLPLDGVDWGLLLVGDGEMREEIENLVTEKGWEDRVEMTGYVPQEEVPQYMRAMDCFVLGSKTTEDWIDTFPRSIVQAMACSVPPVASDSGALPFQVGDAGLVYPEGDVDALHAHVQRLADDDEFRAELGEAAREESVGRFGQEALADGFYEILKQVHSGDIEYNDEDESVQYKAY